MITFDLHNYSFLKSMEDIGVISCSSQASLGYCIIRVIECVISFLMLTIVIIIIIKRLIKEKRFNFNLIVLIMITFFLIFIIAYSIDSSIRTFNFLYLYFYNVYFSTIVLKLALKVQQKYQKIENQQSLRKITYLLFAIYNLCVLASLIYSIIYRQIVCLYLPFLIVNAVGFFIGLVFLILGYTHLKWQQQKFDENIPQNLKNNPMPRFKIWIITNCICEFMILIQAIIYEVNNCTFSQNIIVDMTIKLVFVFLSFHIGIFSTLYFFLYTAPHSTTQNQLLILNTSNRNSQQSKQIQMTYDIRSKNVSL